MSILNLTSLQHFYSHSFVMKLRAVHDNMTAMLCAKFQNDWTIRIAVKNDWYFPWRWISDSFPDLQQHTGGWTSQKYDAQEPVSQRFYELIIQLLKNSCGSYLKNNDPIRSQFCTCHDSWAVMACAKLWPDCVIKIRITSHQIFTIFQLGAL